VARGGYSAPLFTFTDRYAASVSHVVHMWLMLVLSGRVGSDFRSLSSYVHVHAKCEVTENRGSMGWGMESGCSSPQWGLTYFLEFSSKKSVVLYILWRKTTCGLKPEPGARRGLIDLLGADDLKRTGLNN